MSIGLSWSNSSNEHLDNFLQCTAVHSSKISMKNLLVPHGTSNWGSGTDDSGAGGSQYLASWSTF